MLERLEYLIAENKSFAFETTLSGLSYLKFIKLAKLKNYSITIFFVFLNSLELARNRVALRVSKGGHHIPDDVIERRYHKGLQNFSKYAQQADTFYIYDNSTKYDLIAKSIAGKLEIYNFDLYSKISGNGKH